MSTKKELFKQIRAVIGSNRTIPTFTKLEVISIVNYLYDVDPAELAATTIPSLFSDFIDGWEPQVATECNPVKSNLEAILKQLVDLQSQSQSEIEEQPQSEIEEQPQSQVMTAIADDPRVFPEPVYLDVAEQVVARLTRSQVLQALSTLEDDLLDKLDSVSFSGRSITLNY
jgi:hypothetical protein